MTKKINDLKTRLYQMFILGLEGTELKDNPNIIKALHNGLGGVIFFTQNIETEEQFKKLIRDIKKEARISPFLSIDQEGGKVERTENIFGGKKYLSAKFAAAKGKEFLKEQTEQISHDLKNFGINLNFAPCLDVNTNPNNPIIGERAFSSNPDEVIKFGKIVAETYLKNGIIPCAKHFPGHGDANVDSHISLPKIDLPLEEMEKIHIKPFKEVNVPMVMAAHLYCTAFDEEEISSSLSKNVIGYLRDKLNYQGLIITDDMVMGAINKGTGNREQEIDDRGEEAKRCRGVEKELRIHASSHLVFSNYPLLVTHSIQAIKAGVNILLYRNSFDETIQIIENLAQLAQNDKELLENIETSFEKIVNLKAKFLIKN